MIGAGGHAKVVCALRASGVDATSTTTTIPRDGRSVTGCARWRPARGAAVLAAGDNAARRRRALDSREMVTARSAARRGDRRSGGSVVLAGAVVGRTCGSAATRSSTRARASTTTAGWATSRRSPRCGGAILGDGVQAGAGCVVRDHVSVAAGAILGMGCVVTNSVEAAGVLVGVPARRRADLERRHTHCHK